MGWLLDTNIISELQKGDKCHLEVRHWYEDSPESELFVSVLVLGEIRRGVELRRIRDTQAAHSLEQWLLGMEAKFDHRVLPITSEIADAWGRLCLRRQLPVIDGLLAATALHHQLTFVTRNTRDVARSGVKCLDPFRD